jgi:pimeloyl-ACP methyl ester carboxylesterase
MAPTFLKLPDRRLAYQRLNEHARGSGVIFLGGYASDMTGTKAQFLAERCAKAGYPYLRFDYSGHGQSSGAFKDGTIGTWFDDVCEVIDQLTSGPQIVVGSSMGGWMALMLAMKKPERIKALIGVAAAPDFTEDLMWMRFTSDQRAQLERDGVIFEHDPPPDQSAPVTLHLIQEARQHLILQRAIAIHCPVHLLQGLNDSDVPWQHAMRIVEALTHNNVKLTLIKHGDHRLSRSQDLDFLWRCIEGFIS